MFIEYYLDVETQNWLFSGISRPQFGRKPVYMLILWIKAELSLFEYKMGFLLRKSAKVGHARGIHPC